MALHKKRPIIFISSLVLVLAATSAAALDLGLGGVDASLDINLDDDSADADANVGIGGSSVDASVSIGDSTESSTDDPGSDPSGTGGTPGAGSSPGTGGTQGTNGLTTASSGQPNLFPSVDLAALTGTMVISSDGKAIGYVESASVHESGKILVRVALVNSLAQQATHTRILLNKKPPENQTIQIGMTLAHFLRML